MAATTTAAPTSWTTSQAQQITGQSNPVSTANAPLTISNSGSPGNSSSLIPSANNNTSSLIPSAGVSAGTSGDSTSALAQYAKDSAARDKEIARAQAVYQAQAALGNWDAANSAHLWANQVRDTGGLAGTYNTLDGSPLSNPTPKVEEKTPLIPDVPKVTLPELPVYQPYQQQEFQYTPPNYSISTDPSKTSFIPTTRAKDRWLQQEQMNAENAYKQYTSQFGAYQQTYKQQQDAITNALAQKELETKTIAEQAAAALKAAGVKSEAEKVALTAAQNRWQTLGYVANEADAALLGVPVGTKTNDASYRDASLAKGSGGGSSSGITPYQEFQITNTVDAAARDYAKMMAEDEDRIGKPGTYVDANGQTQGVANTYQQIYDAYYQKYLQDYWGKQ